jgi:hypothetical protein
MPTSLSPEMTSNATDAVLGHPLNSFIDGLIGRYEQYSIVMLALQHQFNRVRKFHEALTL